MIHVEDHAAHCRMVKGNNNNSVVPETELRYSVAVVVDKVENTTSYQPLLWSP